MKLTLFLALLAVSSCFSLRDFKRFKLGRLRMHFDEENSLIVLPTIEFTSNYEENVKGKLGVGRAFKIEYDAKRLKGKVSVQYKFNDGPNFETKSLGHIDSDGNYRITLFIPIDADKVVMWFKNEQNEYDSDYGKNYHFAITRPSLVFDSAWRERQHGELVAGGKFDLFYDSKRLKEGAKIESQMKFVDEGKVQGQELNAIDEKTSYQLAEVSIPSYATKIEIWFFYVSKNYDSDYGKNYHFQLA